MHWRVIGELSGADGSVRTWEVHIGRCIPAACSAETLGLTQAKAKPLLARAAAVKAPRSSRDGRGATHSPPLRGRAWRAPTFDGCEHAGRLGAGRGEDSP